MFSATLPNLTVNLLTFALRNYVSKIAWFSMSYKVKTMKSVFLVPVSRIISLPSNPLFRTMQLTWSNSWKENPWKHCSSSEDRSKNCFKRKLIVRLFYRGFIHLFINLCHYSKLFIYNSHFEIIYLEQLVLFGQKYQFGINL